jgi:carboxymethylenebutenolidase
MYRILILLPVIFSFLFFIPQSSNKEVSSDGMSICHTFPVDDMRQFALDPQFQALHDSPLPLDYNGIGKKITFKTMDGTDAKGYFIKAKNKSNKWLLVYQEWWGLNEHIERQSDTFYKDLSENINVLAVDMYDGKSTSVPQEAGKLMSETKDARLVNIVNGAFAFAGPKAKVANVGWCFGGSWSLRSAILGGKNTVGSVMYYGMPVSDIDELKKLNSDVLGLFATETRISKEVIEQFDANMKTAGKKLTYKIFPGVHGFANPSNPKYDEENAKIAYGMALDYLRSKY